MREVIHTHIGQTGIFVGAACWESLCREHNISSDNATKLKQDTTPLCNDENYHIIFQEHENNVTPRALFLDLEQDAIFAVRKKYPKLHHSSNYVFDKEGGYTYTRSYYGYSSEKSQRSMDQLRKLFEECDNSEGLIIHNNLAGGTGSGLTSRFTYNFWDEFGRKKILVGLTLFPSTRFSPTSVQYLNTVSALATEQDMTIMCDNDQLYKLYTQNMALEDVNFVHLNEMVAKINSYLTLPARFGYSHNSLTDLAINLVQNPALHLVQATLAPLLPNSALLPQDQQDRVQIITDQLLDNHNIISSSNLMKGKRLASSVVFGGNVQPVPVANFMNQKASQTQNSTLKFQFSSRPSLSPFPCKTSSLFYQDPFTWSGSHLNSLEGAVLFQNHTGVKTQLRNIANNFDKMWQSYRPFHHHALGEGPSVGKETNESRDDFERLISHYEEAETAECVEEVAKSAYRESWKSCWGQPFPKTRHG